MEKQIVLREPIVWKRPISKRSRGYYAYTFLGDHCIAVRIWYARGHAEIRLLGHTVVLDGVLELDEAKAKAEQLLTDWLRSIATITE